MNDLQKEEFRLLKVFVSVCEKYDIPYFLVCGSALGAVKYGGFIPWDDDADVALFRVDYERFLDIAQKELPSDLFLQNCDTDRKTPFIYSKLRSNNTTFIEKSSSRMDINHGVYIDIFPLDGYPAGKAERRHFELKKQILRRILSSAFYTDCIYKKLLLYPVRMAILRDRLSFYVKKYCDLVKKASALSSDIICNYGNSPLKIEYAPREQYGSGAWATFEGLKVRVPEKYDEYLTQKYGDWRAELPPEQQVGHHYAEVIDLNRPYTDYIEKLPNGKIRIKALKEHG